MINEIIIQDIIRIIQNYDFSEFKNKSVIISGANGFLPAYMVDVLMYLNDNKGYNTQIYAVCRSEVNFRARLGIYDNHQNFHLIISDIVNFTYESVSSLLPEKIDYVIHAASLASPKYYGKDPVGTLLPNIVGTKNLLDIARRSHCESFLLFSSGEVYGEVKEELISEENYGFVNTLDVRSCYAESKRMAENMCISYAHQFNISVKIVRPFHTYGPGMKLDDGRVFADFVSDIVHDKDIELKSDGSAKRPFCYISDAVLAFFMVLEKGRNKEAYNVANPYQIKSIRELAEMLLNLFRDKNINLSFSKKKNLEYIKSKIKNQVPCIAKIEKLGWRPQISIEEGFVRTVRSYS